MTTGDSRDPLAMRLAEGAAHVRAWYSVPAHRGRIVLAALAALVVAGLLLPPVSLLTRATSIGYTQLRSGTQATVRSVNDGSFLEIDRLVMHRSTRVRISRVTGDEPPARAGDLPTGREIVAHVVQVQFKGPRPGRAWLNIPLLVSESQQPFIDPYAWDGQRWRWLAPDFPSRDRVRVELPLDEAECRWVVVTRATSLATELSVAVLPPPSTIPAAIVGLPVVELRAYRLAADDGSVASARMASPARQARLYGVVDNVESGRVRGDLLTNTLIRPEARRRHREAIAALVQRDGLSGIVLDYQGVPDDLQPAYVQFVRDLAADLHARGADLVTTVRMPRRTGDGWDTGPISWPELGAAADSLRITLPAGEPIDAEALDDLVRWSLRHVERGRLQLAVSAQGRDSVDGAVTPISFGTALGHILDMARSDAPGQVAPGTSQVIDLPTLEAAAFGWDESARLWRFNYWDDNRREHTIWLNDASGLSGVFEVAARYRLGRLVLDGVEAGLDPAVWDLARRFLADGDTSAVRTGYKLRWQLGDESGRVVQEAVQPLGESSFTMRAPAATGTYRLTVNLVSQDEAVMALGGAALVSVAPMPAATAAPTALLIYMAPTPMPFTTAPAPPDEVLLQRTPVRIAQPGATATPHPLGARLAVAQAELRAAPDLNADLLSDLRTGVEVELLGRTASGDWLLVRIISTGVEGWVLAELLEYDAPASRVPVLPIGTPIGAAGP